MSYDYFGYKTLERAYLLRVKDKIVERPQQMLMRAMLEQLQAPSGIVSIGAVLNEINLQLDPNLSLSEMLSLAAAVIASPSRVSFTQLSLAPRAGKQTLRQLKPGQTLPLWPQP